MELMRLDKSNIRAAEYLAKLPDMKLLKLLIALSLLAGIAVSLTAQGARGISALREFSPLGEIYLHSLGMADRNRNGAIDRDAGEGYEEFIAQYGNADSGFAVSGVIRGAADGRLGEPEIINHYYIHIRFKHPAETETVESGVRAYIYENNIPLVWLDDEQGTVMQAVNGILGEGWNRQKVTEAEAVRMFNRTMGELRIGSRTGDPAKTGYYTLPEFVRNKKGYCFEIAAFGFFFFSELRINAVTLWAALTNSVAHEIVELTDTKRKVDYSRSSSRYSGLQWIVINPLQSISAYYNVMGANTGAVIYLEKAMRYDKYSIGNLGSLMEYYFNNTGDFNEVAALGDLFLTQNNMDITGLITTRQKNTDLKKRQVKAILLMMYVSYVNTQNHSGYNSTRELLTQHYHTDTDVQQYLRYYTLRVQ